MNKDLTRAYTPELYEDKIYKRWEKSGYFNPDNLDLPKFAPAYTIVLPPPNITDKLHLGHSAVLAIEDLLIRYHRMRGYRSLWIPGTDHAAIATQNVVERKILKEKGKTRHDLGRKKFLKEVFNFVKVTQATILQQTRKMGASLDWSRQAFTLDEPRKKAVKRMFIDMYREGIIYRGERVVNWCPRCHSTLADDEVEYKKERGKLYWLKYGPFILATARPETKLGDTAVAVYPGDKRYKDMVGKEYEIEGVLGKFKVKVVADRSVDPRFGSGAIKVTPAHSFVDSEIAARHNLPAKKIINEDGRMMENCGKYADLTTGEAREAMVVDMKKMGLIDRIEDNYDHNVGVCYRCGTKIEPLPSEQWFVSVDKKIGRLGYKSLKEKAVEVAKAGKIKFIPQRFTKKYLDWMENLHDWCISRQIWFGHEIPVWYKKAEELIDITYFVHGTTVDNATNKASGHYDVELSALGVKQSKDLAKIVKNQDFDIVFCSDLKRAVTSANIAFRDKGVKIIQDKRLRECDYGDLTRKDQKIVETMEKEVINIPFPNGESYKDVEERVKDFLRELADKYAGKKVAILSHKAPQLALDVILRGKTWEEAFDEDWRKKKAWQPGWKYELKKSLKQETRNVKTWDLKIYGSDIFQALKSGTKTIETRAGKPVGAEKYWGDFKPGDEIEFRLADEKTDVIIQKEASIKKIVSKVIHFDSLEKMFKKYGSNQDYPGKSEKEIKKWWAKYPLLEKRIKKYGVWVFELKDESEAEIYVGEKAPAGKGWVQDPDTLDTWFSSGMWTFSTLGWPDNFKNGKKTGDLASFHPTQVLETGYEILTLWVSRMIMMSLFALGEIPFANVYLHGMILDERGKKMSKSKGNGIDPIDVINKFGTDAVRLSLLLGNTSGNDTRISEEKIAGYRNFANKLWNIGRFIRQNEEINPGCPGENNKAEGKINFEKLTLADKWILANLERLVERVTEDIENFEFSQAGEKLRGFTWNGFADWYLEISKFEKTREKNKILAKILRDLLKLWHPFMPFITEAIWQEMNNGGLLMVAEWPRTPATAKREKLQKLRGLVKKQQDAIDSLQDDGAIKNFEQIKDIIVSVRNARAENKVEPARNIKAVIYAGGKKELIETAANLIKGLRTGIGELEVKKGGEKIKGEIYITVGGIEIYLIGAINKGKEEARIKKEIDNLEKLIVFTTQKLSNQEFINKAPKVVVDKEEERLKFWQEELKKLQERLNK